MAKKAMDREYVWLVCSETGDMNYRTNVRVKGGIDDPIPDNKTLGVFLQDDWRLTDRLTLSLGLRYDEEDITDDSDNYAPRLGFAWDPVGKGKTVVRGGWGRFYDRFQYGFYQAFFQDAINITQGFILRFPNAGVNQQLFFDLAQANGITTLTGLRDFLVNQASLVRVSGSPFGRSRTAVRRAARKSRSSATSVPSKVVRAQATSPGFNPGSSRSNSPVAIA